MNPSFRRNLARWLHCNLHGHASTLLGEESEAEGVWAASFADEEAADCSCPIVQFGIFIEKNVADLFDSPQLALGKVSLAGGKIFVAEAGPI